MRTHFLTLAALVAAALPLPLRAQTAAGGRVTCAPGNGGLSLPSGLCAAVVARDLGPVRHVAVAPNGDVFANVANRGHRRAARYYG
ncbi:MAG TPA: hypothetical protein VHJ69_08910 [Gemmatimonadales bacterium]|nr:hypothetical protein [Gemmatimonadales bacterium]